MRAEPIFPLCRQTDPIEHSRDRAEVGQSGPSAGVNAPLLVDAIEAARLLGISPRTLWDLTKSGDVKAKRIGRRVLYARSVLEEFATK